MTAIRVMKAVVLLKYTQKSIAEISAECGYVDSSHFIKTTNKIFGSPPHRLRKEMIEISQRYKDQKIASEKLHKWESTLDSETRLEHFKISLGEDIIST